MTGDQYGLFDNRPPPSHLATGEKLKADGLDATEAYNETWVQIARRQAYFFAIRPGSKTVTTDDLRRWADRTHQQPDSPNAWGAVFRGKGWKVVGYTKSTYGPNHARRICVWRWVG